MFKRLLSLFGLACLSFCLFAPRGSGPCTQNKKRSAAKHTSHGVETGGRVEHGPRRDRKSVASVSPTKDQLKELRTKAFFAGVAKKIEEETL